MNKRIKKKVAIRKCEKGFEKIKRLIRADYEQDEDGARELIEGLEHLYSRRIASIKRLTIKSQAPK